MEDYVLRFQSFREDSYEYDLITSPRDVKKTVEEGKKVVFLRSKEFAKLMFIIGGFCLSLGLVLALIISARFPFFGHITTFSIIMIGPGSVALFFFIVALWDRSLSFLVLGAEGIAYKLRRSSIIGYKWEDIKMDFYNPRLNIFLY